MKSVFHLCYLTIVPAMTHRYVQKSVLDIKQLTINLPELTKFNTICLSEAAKLRVKTVNNKFLKMPGLVVSPLCLAFTTDSDVGKG